MYVGVFCVCQSNESLISSYGVSKGKHTFVTIISFYPVDTMGVGLYAFQRMCVCVCVHTQRLLYICRADSICSPLRFNLLFVPRQASS